MKKITLIFSLSIIYIAVSAQRLGFIGGYQLTSSFALVGGYDVDFNAKLGSGFHIGGYFDWDFTKNKRFGFDAQLLYAMRTTKFDLHYVSDTTMHFRRNTYNLEVPLHFYAKFKVTNDWIFTPFLGPSFNIGLHGKDIAWQNTELQKPIDLRTKDLYGKDNRLNRFEIAGEAGLMLKYKNYGVRALYSVGLTNLTTKKYDFGLGLPSNQSRYIFNGVFKVSFVYAFNLRE